MIELPQLAPRIRKAVQARAHRLGARKVPAARPCMGTRRGHRWCSEARNFVAAVPTLSLRSGLTFGRNHGCRAQRAIPVTSQRTTTLWRPTGLKELDLVRESDWRAWPPRLPEQPIFYPVLNEDYAVRIARDWNVKHDGAGFVTRFEVESEFLRRYPVQQVGGQTILELWVPAEELEEFNAHIVGRIRVVHEFR